MRTVITFGTFDVFHYGHLRILERAASLGDRLVVGVSSDALNKSKKDRYPIYSQYERMSIVAGLRCVHQVFLEESLDLKKKYIDEYGADVIVMGDDWAGKFDNFGIEAAYFERTPCISSTEVIERCKEL